MRMTTSLVDMEPTILLAMRMIRMMHGFIRVNRTKGFKPEAGQAYHLRGCLTAPGGSITNRPLGKQYMEVVGATRLRESMSCSTGGHWMACCECDIGYDTLHCKEYRKGKMSIGGSRDLARLRRGVRPIHHRLIYFHSIAVSTGSYDEWKANSVWEDGYR